MATKKTINLLPTQFRTDTNQKFLSATLDQLTSEPVLTNLSGFVGRKFAPTFKNSDSYVIEPSVARTNYQLEPSIIVRDSTNEITFYVDYIDFLNKIGYYGGSIDNHDRLFTSEYYSYNPLISYDTLINYSQYYWLPHGPNAVAVFAGGVELEKNFTIVRDAPNNKYILTSAGKILNNEIMLARGGEYRFTVDQVGYNFWIQTELGIDGAINATPTINSRSVLGVSNNGEDVGTVTFVVPASTAQDRFALMPTVYTVDFTTSLSYARVQNQLLSQVLKNPSLWDGLSVTQLNGKSFVFIKQDDLVRTEDLVTEDDFWTVQGPYETVSWDMSLWGLAAGWDPASFAQGEIVPLDERTSVWTIRLVPASNNITFNEPVTVAIGDLIVQPVSGAAATVIEAATNSTSIKVRYDNERIFEVVDPMVSFPTSGGDSRLIRINNVTQYYYTTVDNVVEFHGIVPAPSSDNDYVIRLDNRDNTGVKRIVNRDEKVFVRIGHTNANKHFYRTLDDIYKEVPLITCIQDYLYFQDQIDSEIYGVFKIVDASNFKIDVNADILGRTNYTSPNGVEFTNGLKITFDVAVTPISYQNNTYYVAGVGDAIRLVDVTLLVTPEEYNNEIAVNFPEQRIFISKLVNANIPIGTTILIGSTEILLNAAAPAGIDYLITLSDVSLLTAGATVTGTGITSGTSVVDIVPNTIFPNYITIDRGSLDLNAWSRNNRWFHKNVIDVTALYNDDVAIYNQASRAQRPIVQFNADTQLLNFGRIGKRQVDIIDTTTLDAFNQWQNKSITNAFGVDLVDGMRIIFAADRDPLVRNKIYVLSLILPYIDDLGDPYGALQINLTIADDGEGEIYDTVVVMSGIYTGTQWWYNGDTWISAQQKTTLQQSPLYDIFDTHGSSLTTKIRSSFAGTKLFGYKIGTSATDAVLGFPISYKSLVTQGDIEFSNYIDLDEYSFAQDNTVITAKVAEGFLHTYTDRTTVISKNIWETVVVPSRQNQLLNYYYNGTNNPIMFDILPEDEVLIPTLTVYVNNKEVTKDNYFFDKLTRLLTIFSPLEINDRIDVEIYSKAFTANGYYDIPKNLNYNAQNIDFTSMTLGQLRTHTKELISNSLEIQNDSTALDKLRDHSIVEYGGTILQHSSPLSYGMLFLIDEQANFSKSLRYAQNEYTKFKNKFLELVVSLDGIDPDDPAASVDLILSSINAVKNKSFPWYYSDMVPHGKLKTTIEYTIFDPFIKTYQLSSVFEDTKLSNRAVLIYLNGTQLIKDLDFSFNTTLPAFTFNNNTVLEIDDIIMVVDYENTDGSFVPETPSKLGLYPKFYPELFEDDTYRTAINVIRGHDGSITPAFNDYRDAFLLELEYRIFNNIKIANTEAYQDISTVVPTKFRDNDYSWTEFNQVLTHNFLIWVGNNRLNFSNNDTFKSNDPFTWNYSGCIDRIDGQYLPGSWRAAYLYYYGTISPHQTPWEMLGFAIKPTWWETYYGPAPYTGTNLFLWEDLEKGLIREGPRAGIDINYARPGVLGIIPVDPNGFLCSPAACLTQSFNVKTASDVWQVGECGPVEYAWRTSSEFPFAMQQAFALTKPGKYFGTMIDTSSHNKDNQVNQYLTGLLHHIRQQAAVLNGVTDTGEVSRASGYLNWIADYLTGLGISPNSKITSLLESYQINLTYRMAGFTDHKLINVLAEQNSPSSINSGIVIPAENYKIHLYKSTPIRKMTYSAVIVEKTGNGYSVRGYNLSSPYFTVVPSVINSNVTAVSVLNRSVSIFRDHQDIKVTIPYGYELRTLQQVADFLISYERGLIAEGFVFTEFNEELGETRNWKLSVKEFLYWAQQGWKTNSVLVLSPIGATINAVTSGVIVDEVTNSALGSKLLDLNFNVINSALSNVLRSPTTFTLNIPGETVIGYAEFNLVQYEHALVFDNITVFNDVIYKPELGNRQYRLKLVGQKTADWDGSLHAPGYIFNTAKIDAWTAGRDYLKGELVTYKTHSYVALQSIIATIEFQFDLWARLEDTEIKTGLLSNFSTLETQSKGYYDSYAPIGNFDNLTYSHGLIGFRPRQYMADLGISEPSQIEFYKGYIKQKGSLNAVTALTTAEFNNLKSSIVLREEWAIRVGEYGAISVNPYVEVPVGEQYFSINTGAISFVDAANTNSADGISVFNEQQLYKSEGKFDGTIALNRDSHSNYVNDIPTAGYVNIDDVSTTIYDLADIHTLNEKLAEIGSGYTIWCAKDLTQNWNVFRVTETGVKVISIAAELDRRISLGFNNLHNLVENDVFMVKNYSPTIDGFYLVDTVVDIETVIVRYLGDTTQLSPATGDGVLFALDSLRFTYMEDARQYVPPYGWKPGEKIWIDIDAATTLSQGQAIATESNTWKVYEKTAPWAVSQNLLKDLYITNDKYGTSVKLSPNNLFSVAGSPEVGLIILTLTSGISTTITADIDSYMVQPISGARARILHSAVNSTSISAQYVEGSPVFDISQGPVNINTVFRANSTSTTTTTTAEFTAIADKVGEVNIFVRNFADDFLLNATLAPTATNTKSFGSSINLADETLMVGAPSSDSNRGHVYIYDKPEGTSTFAISQIISGPDAADLFGSSITSDGAGDWLYVSAPGHDKVYVYGLDKNVTTVAKIISVLDGASNVSLGFTPKSIESMIVSSPFKTYLPTTDYHISGAGNVITFTSAFTSNLELVVSQKPYFSKISNVSGVTGSSFGAAIDTNKLGEILAVGAPKNDVTVDSVLKEDAGSVYVYDRRIEAYYGITDAADVDGLIYNTVGNIGTVHRVTIDNQEIAFSDYTTANLSITLATAPALGSVIHIETNVMDLVQTLTGDPTVQSGAQFGTSLTVCSSGCAVYVGAPYHTNNYIYNTGAVWKFHNRGKLYGTNTGTVLNPVFVIGDSIRLDGFEVVVGNITLDGVVNNINSANILGVSAANLDGYLQINSDQTKYKDVLHISSGIKTGGSPGVLTTAGLSVNAYMQTIINPYDSQGEYFGSKVVLSSSAYTLLIASDRGSTTGYTTFDDDTMTLDNNTTFITSIIRGSGSAYIYELYDDPRNVVEHPGRYTFVQQLNPTDLNPGDLFGADIDITDNYVVVSAPLDDTQLIDAGSVYMFKNTPKQRGWNLLRYEQPIVNIESVNRIYLYNKISNTITNSLEFIDPIKGKILGLAEQEISYKTEYDPATYNRGTDTPAESINLNYYWSDSQVGKVWWDLSRTRFIYYEQGDLTFRNVNWGRLFPGSDVEVYEWVESLYLPSLYVKNGGDGVPKYPTDTAYVEVPYVNPLTNNITSKYFYWVKDTTSVAVNSTTRRFPTIAIKSMIESPGAQGIAYAAILQNNAVILYNVGDVLSGTDIILHIDHEATKTDSIIHSEYELWRDKDHLAKIPKKILNKFIDSLSGINSIGEVVPDPALSTAIRYGISVRPRQGMFVDTPTALANFVSFVNDILILQPLAKTRDLTQLKLAELPPKLELGEVDAVLDTDIELEYIDTANLSVGYKILITQNTSEDNLWTVHQLQANKTWRITKVQSYKTELYWVYADWFAPGVSSSDKVTYRVDTYNDALKLASTPGDIIKIDNSGNGEWQWLQTVSTGVFVVIAIQNGTFQLEGLSAGSSGSELGFGEVGYSTSRYDQSSNVEIRAIITALNDDIFIEDLDGKFNELIAVMINYIFTEQKYVDWIFKTSFIHIFHTLRDLAQYPSYTKDNQDYLRDYISEVKPYAAKIREYLIGYNGKDTFTGDITDFDLPAYYDTDMQMFRSPALEGNSGQLAKDNQLVSTGYIDDTLINLAYVQWNNNRNLIVDQILVEYPGSGYVTEPKVVMYGGGPSAIMPVARAIINFDTGEVTSIEIIDPGKGFSSTPTVEIQGDTSDPARAYAVLKNYQVRSVDTTLKFDRTGYRSQVKDWIANTLYKVGDLIRYAGAGYQVNLEHTSTTIFNYSIVDLYASNLYANALDRVKAYYSPSDTMPVIETVNYPLVITRDAVSSYVLYVDNLLNIRKGMYISGGAANSAVITDAVLNVLLLSGNVTVLEGDSIFQAASNLTASVLVKDPWTTLIKVEHLDSEFIFGEGNLSILRGIETIETTIYPVARVNYLHVDRLVTAPSGTSITVTYDDLTQLMQGLEYPEGHVVGLEYMQQPGFDAASGRPYSAAHGIQLLSEVDRDLYYANVQIFSSTIPKNLWYNSIEEQTYQYSGDYPYNSISGWTPIIYNNSGAAFDSSVFDNVDYDVDGVPILSDQTVDSIIQSNYTDMNLGLRIEDIIVDGSKYLSPITSYAPEELVPGMMFDTVDIQVYTAINGGDDVLGYRIFNNLLRETSYLRIADSYATLLSADLLITDTELFVFDASKLPDPSPPGGRPGVIFVGSERITYYTKTGNILGRLRRGTEGTGAPAIHPTGSPVVDAGLDQVIPAIEINRIDTTTGTAYLASEALSYNLKLTGNVSANVGAYISQVTSGANVIVVGSDSTDTDTLLVEYINPAAFTYANYILELSLPVTVIVGQIVTQSSTGANLTVMQSSTNNANILVKYTSLAGVQFGSGNVVINGGATAAYPVEQAIDFDTSLDMIYINGTLATTPTFPVAVKQAGLLDSTGRYTMQSNVSLTTTNAWFTPGVDSTPADGTGFEGTSTEQVLFLKNKTLFGNIGYRLEQWYAPSDPMLNTLTAIETESGILIIEE